MLLRMSSLFLRTLREDPADADVPSHRLLLRAGYLRRLAPGGYAWLPLGKLVIDQICRVIREEMAAIGAQEVALPALLPREPYQASGRWTEYGPEIFRVRDRRGADHLLAPTHEEPFTLLVKDLYRSYKDYPVILYQIQSKFRDEPRPRAGVLRGREFLMKDAYSFDLSAEDQAASYAAHRAVYQRILRRLEVSYEIVAATAGAMGGSASEEFLARSPIGEDSYAHCPGCGYAANTEALTTPVPHAAVEANHHPPVEELDTPDTPTIESLVCVVNAIRAGGRSNWTAAQSLKNVVLTVTAPGAQAPELLVVGVPGDREVDLKRIGALLYPAQVALFDDFTTHTDLVKGYLGPQGQAWRARYLVDPRVSPGSAWVTGANRDGRHAINVVCGRDFQPDGTIEAVVPIPGDPCPVCHGPLELARGIEVGHIFALGRRYSDVFGLDALGPQGKPIRVIMGSYGIGVSRLVATVAEQHHDSRGLCWPAEIAPAQLHIVALGDPGPALDAAAAWSRGGLRVLVDDRAAVSAGVKFADAELIGAPTLVVFGRRVADGFIEVRDRATGASREVALDDLSAVPPPR